MDNVMLAQLMKDMQDPEMMREAQRMMQDPSFQAYMQQMMSQQKMQQAIQTTKQTIADPKKLQQLEIKTKLALKDGEKKLKEIEKLQQEQQQQNNDDTTKKTEATDDADTNTNDESKQLADANNGVTSETALLSDNDEIPNIPVFNLN